MRRLVLAAAVAVVAGLVASIVGASPAAAHPLGRFTVNQYAGLIVSPSAVHVDYVVDMAELPAFQARGEQADADRDGTVTAAEGERYAASACTSAAGSMRLTVDGTAAVLAVQRSAVVFPPGEGGLPTLRLECALRAGVTSPGTVAFANGAFPEHAGWHEVTAAGDGLALTESDVPAGSVSARLRSYPRDPLAATSDVRAANLRAGPGSSPHGAAGRATDREAPRDAGFSPAGVADRMTGALARVTGAFDAVLDRRELTVGVGVLGIALALALGAAHAVAPGHGKTVMAAVLLGERGTWRQAAVIALGVTVTHTTGVLLLGLALATSLVFAPERVYGVLAAAGGLLLALIGVCLLRTALRHRRHARPHHHHHHEHGPVRLRTLLALGFAGGLLPSPSAVVVLLGAVALGRPWYGVLLVVAYGLGMAIALIGIGLAVSRWAPALSRRLPRRLARWQPALPVVTAGVIVLIGVTLTTQAVLTQA